MSKHNLAVMTSSKSDIWGTPPELFDKLNKVFNFTLDPAANAENAKCPKFYTEADNGLVQDWADEVVFCNPPYSNIQEWIRKARFSNAKSVVMLIPARVETAYWFEHIWNKADEVLLIKGRLKFVSEGCKDSAPFPTALVLYGRGTLYYSGINGFIVDQTEVSNVTF